LIGIKLSKSKDADVRELRITAMMLKQVRTVTVCGWDKLAIYSGGENNSSTGEKLRWLPRWRGVGYNPDLQNALFLPPYALGRGVNRITTRVMKEIEQKGFYSQIFTIRSSQFL